MFRLLIALISGQFVVAQAKPTAVYMMTEGYKPVPIVEHVEGFEVLNSPEISPDGKWVAVDGWGQGQNFSAAHVLLIRVADGHVVDMGLGSMPTWSPDGEWLAICKTGRNPGVHLLARDGRVELIDREGWGIQWSPDGEFVSYTDRGQITVLHLLDDTRTVIQTGYSNIWHNTTWSADSSQICFKGTIQDRDEFAILDLKTQKIRVVCDGIKFNPDISWHPTKDIIAVPAKGQPMQRGQIFTIDLAAPNPTPERLSGQPADRSNGGLCWSRDGKTLVFVSR